MTQNQKKLSGVFAPIMTPFKDDELCLDDGTLAPVRQFSELYEIRVSNHGLIGATQKRMRRGR